MKKFLGVMMLILLIIPTAHMQAMLSSAASGVVMYEYDTGTLYSVEDNGISIITVLSSVVEFEGDNKPDIRSYQLSSDGSRFIFATVEQTNEIPRLRSYYVADVRMGTCCQKLDPQDNTRSASGHLMNPEGDQIAVGYIDPFAPEGDYPRTSQIVVFDLKTADVIAHFDYARLGEYKHSNSTTRWTSEGIQFYYTDDWIEFRTVIWHPDTDVLDEPVKQINEEHPFWSTLNSTREMVKPVTDPAYPSALLSENGIQRTANAVLYTSPDASESTVIYSRPNMLFIEEALWIANGQALLITHAGPTSTILLRDGTHVTVDVEENIFLGGTHDGWIMENRSLKTYVYYRLHESSVEVFPVGEFIHPAVVVYQSESHLSSSHLSTFPEVTVP